MYSSRFLSIVLVCCTLTGTSSDISDPTIIEKLNMILMHEQYEPLSLMLVAASTGKNLYKMAESLTEDCVRTAKVALNLYQKPSKFSVTKPVVFAAGQKCSAQLKANFSQNAMELFCDLLNDEFKNKSADFTDYADFDKLKLTFILPKPTKDYYMNVLLNDSTGEVRLNKTLEQLDSPAFLRFFAVNGLLFLGFQTHVDETLVEPVAISTAIQKMASEKAYRTEVDSAFDILLDDYVKDLANRTDDDYGQKLFFYNHNPELIKINQAFLQTPTLKDEYAKIKNETTDELRQTERIRAHL